VARAAPPGEKNLFGSQGGNESMNGWLLFGLVFFILAAQAPGLVRRSAPPELLLLVAGSASGALAGWLWGTDGGPPVGAAFGVLTGWRTSRPASNAWTSWPAAGPGAADAPRRPARRAWRSWTRQGARWRPS
jgi:hypothetical protein